MLKVVADLHSTLNIQHSTFLVPSYLHEAELSTPRINRHCLSRLVPRRQDGDARAGGGEDELLMEVAEDDVGKAGFGALAAVVLEVRDRQPRLVLEVRARQALLHAVDERARHAARHEAQP